MKRQRKKYKSYELYCCFTLNQLVNELDFNVYQEELEEKLDVILSKQQGLSKRDVKFEIRSNNYMTNKVLQKLEREGLAEIERLEERYIIKITKKGVLHVKNYNDFYWEMFSDHIIEHYKYKGMPHWFERLK